MAKQKEEKLLEKFKRHAELAKTYLRMFWASKTPEATGQISAYEDVNFEQTTKPRIPQFYIEEFFEFAEIVSEGAAPFLDKAKDNEMHEFLLNTWEKMTLTPVDRQRQLE